MVDDPTRRLQRVPWAALVPFREPLLTAISGTLGGEPAERVLDAFLRAHRPMNAEARAACAEAIFGVSLWRRRLAWHVGLEGDASGADPGQLLFALMRDLAGVSSGDAAAVSGVFSDPASVCGTGAAQLLSIRPVPDDWRVRESFPDWLADHLERELGVEGAAGFARAVNVPGPIVLRANRLVLSDREALRARLTEEGVATHAARWAEDALIVDTERPNLLGTSAQRDGAFEVQDEGSQLIGALADARPGMSVLDYCAGAGGKTLQLASMMRNEGALHAWDVDRSRLERLRGRARHSRATNVRIHLEPPPESLQVDVVLADAPCSEIGPLRRGPDVRWRLDPERLRTLPSVQSQILESAQRHVRPGGRLVYATCTINRAENEEVAEWFERAHAEFLRIAPLAPEEFVSPDRFFRTLPQVHGTDGFFAAVWERRT